MNNFNPGILGVLGLTLVFLAPIALLCLIPVLLFQCFLEEVEDIVEDMNTPKSKK